MMAIPVSVIVGAPISEALLKLDGTLGLRGWQWLFLVEGLPAVVVGVWTLFYLTDTPEKATWLAPEQRTWLTETMTRERSARISKGHASVLSSLRSGKLWLLCAIYFMNTLVTYGVFLWLPRILRDASSDTGWSVGWLTALPFVVALSGMVLVGRHSDRTGERKWHVAVCALVAASGLLLAVGFQDNVWMLVVSFTLCQLGQRSLLSVFWAIPPIFLGGSAAAAGIALINSLGNLGGFVGPTVVGSLRGSSGNYTSGPARARRGAGHRGDPGRVDAVAAADAGRAPATAAHLLEHVRQRDHGRDCYSDDDGPVDPVHRVGKARRRIRAGGGDDVETTGLQTGADRRRAEPVGDQLQHSAPVRLPQLDDFQHHKNSAGDCDGGEGGKQARTRRQEGGPRAKQQERIRGHREPPGQDAGRRQPVRPPAARQALCADVGAPAAVCAGPTCQTSPCARTRRRPERRGRPWRR